MKEEIPPLSNWVRWAFGIGAIGEMVYLGMFNTFIGIFYNQAIGLSNSLVGTAILLALVGDAISDPAVGILSDRNKSRFGRRHPFLFFAPLPLALALWCIFNPPTNLIGGDVLDTSQGQLLLFLWLTVWTIVSRVCLTLYVIPHLALGGEIVRDPHERSKLFSLNSVFGIATGALFAFLAWSVFLSGESPANSGEMVPNHLVGSSYLPLSLFAGALIFFGIFLCAAGTYSRVPYLSKPAEDLAALSLKTFFEKILGTLKNKNYLFLLIGVFFFTISSGLYETFNVFVNTYFWELLPEQIRWLSLTMVPGVIGGALFAPILMRKYDRRPALMTALVGVVLFAQLPIDLRLFGLFPHNGSPLLLPLLLTNIFFFALAVGIGSVAILAMLADVVDENELATGLREEGLFYSARTFFSKLSGSVAHFVAGILLDVFVQMPFEAVPGEVDAGVITRLGIAAGPIMGLAGIVAGFFYHQYKLDKNRHAEVIAELAERAKTP